MSSKPPRGLFITGTDTAVGKTYVTALVAHWLVEAGHRVGVYKPVASGCTAGEFGLICDDAQTIWRAAGSPGELARVCPQMFAAPLAPHLAAAREGKQIDARLLRDGLSYWLDRSDIVLVEGAGGLMSPVGEDEYVADLALDFGFPLVVVAPNVLGAINQVLQTLIVAATFRDGLDVAGIVLNRLPNRAADPSTASNRQDVAQRTVPPVLADIGPNTTRFDPAVDWWAWSREGRGIRRETAGSDG